MYALGGGAFPRRSPAGTGADATVAFFYFPRERRPPPLIFLSLQIHSPCSQAALEASALGTSGALAAFSLVFLSELGDKTFFLAGLLAMRVGRSAALVGSVAALALMTGVSVAIGAAFQAVPSAISSSVNISKWASVACLVYFGLKTLKAAWETPAGGPALGSGGTPASSATAATATAASAPADLAPELAAAQEELEAAEQAGRVHDTAGKAPAADASAFATWARSASEVASIIFLAEWGDRSMLATIALAAAQNPAGVAAGAVGGHAVATAIAVWGGVLVARHLSERTVGLIGGALFLAFAGLTLGGWM